MNNYSRSIQITKPSVVSERGMVTANHRAAASVGAAILERGGHAVDAAVATSFMLGVCEPWMSGIGGCGQILVYTASTGRVEAFDLGTISPRALDPADYPLSRETGANLFNWPRVVDARNNVGPHAICLPTLVRGMDELHRRYGRLPWADLVMPSAEQAAGGLEIDAYASLFIGSAARELRSDPVARATFLDADGLPPTIAWTNLTVAKRPWPQLAETLNTIAREGADSLYSGSLAKRLVEDLNALGNRLTPEEFAEYRPRIAIPVTADIAGHRIHVAPGMNAGPNLINVLNSCQHIPNPGAPGADEFLVLIAALRRTQDERLTSGGDDGEGPADSCTTHFNVIDADGNMAVVTQTLLSVFGSKVVSEQTGILLNNGLLWFDPEPGKPNSIGPGKRPLSNMCPVIVTGPNEANCLDALGIGGAGGRRILPAVSQILWRMLFKGETLEAAFHAPRFDTSLSDIVTADYRIGAEVLAVIGANYPLQLAERHIYPYSFACPSAISRRNGTNEGCTEVYSLWGDTVVAGASGKEP